VQLHCSHHDYGPAIKRVRGTCLKNLQSDQSTGGLRLNRLTSHNPKHHCGPNPTRCAASKPPGGKNVQLRVRDGYTLFH
jgi:hypothetical protein